MRFDSKTARVTTEYKHGNVSLVDVKNIDFTGVNLDSNFNEISLILTGESTSDVVIYSSRIQWEKSDKTY